jgi:small-conductance mechanosensitive channel
MQIDFELTRWPLLNRTIWTAATLAIAFGLGLLINSVIVRRLQRLAERTKGDWDDVVILELRRRVPLWSGLIGLWLSIGYWPLSPRSAGFLSNLVAVVAILSVTTGLSAIAVRLMSSVAPRLHPEMQVSGLMRNVVRIVIFTVGTLVLLQGIGVEITPMLAALGVGGLAVALALQEPLSNLFAGLFITIAGQVRIGDYIRMEPGPEGVIADFSWNATQLMTGAGNVVIVPNSKLTQAIITNFHRPSRDTGMGVELTIVPGADLAVVERIGVEVAKAVMRDVVGGVATAEPNVRFIGYSDLGVKVSINVRTREFNDQALVRHELIKRVQTALGAAGIAVATTSKEPAPR